ncbi:MAG: MBL fold metallo-hydrolase [Magnetovibrio sp.]|nr:MBL fold metallo-hydrolase [Magnetovibrio sp.]|tara:strand:- start:2495 stop:3277 length:783 start_codon:yes stop_codon:yes gene_type:complete
MQITILGSGPSSGVPGIGIGWGNCDPKHKKNKRLRPSILIKSNDTTILIDTSPDLRHQLLHSDIHRLDAVMYTHAHADHLHGIDDLRGINRAMNAPLDIYANAETLALIAQRFPYTLTPLNKKAKVYYKPVLTPHEIIPGCNFSIANIEIQAFDQDHGFSSTLGFRFGNLAYTTDLIGLTEETFVLLEGVHTWIIGVFSDGPHPTHINVDTALNWRNRINPQRMVMTHLGPSLDYNALLQRLPEGAEPAYDFMTINVPET